MLGIERFLYIYDFIRPFLDISILTFLLYKAYDFISKTNSIQILEAIVIIGVAYGIAVFLDLKTILWILNIMAPGMVIAFAVIFQPEIRKIFLKIGQDGWYAFGTRSEHTFIDAILTAAENLALEKRGMLVVFKRQTKLDDIIQNGTSLNADLTSNLLMTIFEKDTALHDGACVVLNGKVVSAGCFLPLSTNYSIKKTFGTRHRAALGLSEVSDAVVLVVSEETGAISLAYDSKLNYDLSIPEIRKVLENLLNITSEQKNLKDTINEHK